MLDVAAGGEVVTVLGAVDEVAFETTLTAPEELPDEASELSAARVSGPKKPVEGVPCAVWNCKSAWYV